MKVYYARVSSADQNLGRQLKQAEELNITKIYQEKKSGKDISGRPEFQKMMKFLREGDSLYVASLDRIGRNYTDVLSTINQLRDKKVALNVVDAPYLSIDSGNPLLDRALSDMMVSLLSYVAENERAKIRERQRQGIELAKQKGIYKGKPAKYSKDSNDQQGRAVYAQAITMYESGLSAYQVSKRLAIGHSTADRIKAEYENSLNNTEDS